MKLNVSARVTWSCLLLGLVFATAAGAAPGDLDPTFGGTGEVLTGLGFGNDGCDKMVVQTDGKLLLAGNTDTGLIEIVRVGTNYQLDTTFGNGGKVFTSGFSNAFVTALAVQPDGKFIVAGSATVGNYSDFELWRYNTNGVPDASFGTGGVATTDFGQVAQLQGIAIQADGKTVAAGYINGNDFALARYNTNGTLDTSFGTGGKVDTSANGDAAAYAVLLPGDGTILAAGTGGFNFALIRYTTNGVLDTTFGAGTGKVFTQIGSHSDLSTANAISIQPAGLAMGNPAKIVLAGTTFNSHVQIAVARYNLDGTIDTTFGTNGIFTGSPSANAGSYEDYAQAVIATRAFNNVIKVTVGGYGISGTNNYFELVRLTGTGTLDTTINGTGVKIVQIGAAHSDQANSMAFGAGTVLLAGTTAANSANTDIGVVSLSTTDGSLSTNFNGTGILTIDAVDRTSEAKAVVRQPDGKYVAAGDAFNGVNNVFALVRYNPDGSLDSSFGTGGKATTAFASGSANGNAAVLQPDGKIVLAGSAYDGTHGVFAVARYNANGSLDSSFGTNGTLLTLVGSSNSSANAMALQSDGKIVVVGSSYNGANNDFAAARYLTNGTLDTTFGTGGKQTTAIASGEDQGASVGIQTDGKIVVAGYGTLGSTLEFAAIRYTTNGVLDTSFGSGGRQASSIPGQAAAEGLAMAIQTNGRAVIAGVGGTVSTEVFAALRYLTNGALDTSFNGSGAVTTQVGLSVDIAYSMALQSDGKILLAGWSQTGQYNDFATVRYNGDGTLDSGYGINGKSVQTFNTGLDENAYGVALDPSNGAMLAGSAGGVFALMKLSGDFQLKILSITHLANGHNMLTGTGVPNGSHTLRSTPSLKTNFSTLGPVQANSSGAWQYDDGSVTGVTNRFYRLSYP